MNIKPTIIDALHSIYPNADAVIKDGEIISTSEPVDESLFPAKLAELQTEYDAQEYARNRQAEYPSLDDLIVALWEGVVEERMASVTALEALRQAVKTKYPKP